MSLIPALTLSFLVLYAIITSPAAAQTETRSLLEFLKGIKSDPTNRIFSTWVPPANQSECPSGFHGVVCDPYTSSVTSISLDGLALTGELKFTTLISLKFLQNLTLSGNEFTGRLVPGLGVMSSLQVVDLSGNRFYGPVPGRINELWNLRVFNLSNNRFSGGFPDGIGNLQQLKVLDLSFNELHGGMPNLTQFQSLNFLSIRNNSIEGTLPLAFGSYSKLTTVDLSSQMESLDLSNNLLTGKISPDIGNWGRLKSINFAYNNLSGHLPEELSKLGGLEYLNLSHNNFDGNIPGKLPVSLKILDLSYNKLSGKIPDNLKNFPESSFSGHDPDSALGFPSGNSENMHKGKRNGASESVRIAIIVASLGAAIMIAFVLFAYIRARFLDLQ